MNRSECAFASLRDRAAFSPRARNISLACGLALSVLSAAGAAFASGAEQGATPVPPAAPAASAAASATPTVAPASSGPFIRVHNDQVAKDTRDSRVTINGMTFSSPSWSPMSPTSPTSPATSSSADTAPGSITNPVPFAGQRTDGLISVPSNTLGENSSPGAEPLWVRREREQARLKSEQARADQDRAFADRSLDTDTRRYRNSANFPGGYVGTGYFNRGYLGNGYRDGFGYRGLQGPVTVTTSSPFEGLGSSAQREFANAAAPRLTDTENARAQGVIQFGQNATPPIARTQAEIDQAFLNAQCEKLPK